MPLIYLAHLSKEPSLCFSIYPITMSAVSNKLLESEFENEWNDL